MINKIQTTLKERGPMTCLQLVPVTGTGAPELVNILRRAVNTGLLADRNGFYDIAHDEGSPRRTSYRWVEGNLIPEWVKALAVGVYTCEGIPVITEISSYKRKKGWPPFQLATIDMRLSIIVCASTGENITRHVLRYMPLDTSKVRPL